MHSSDTPIFWETMHDLGPLMSAPPRAATSQPEPAPLKVTAQRLPNGRKPAPGKARRKGAK
jgi:hypothetical protein